MSDWYSYNWELAGQPAAFHVDLSFVDAFDALGDFTTLLYVSCFCKRENAAAFTPRELRRLPGVLSDCLEALGRQAVCVGFIDVQAQRRYYFYASDPRLLVPLMHVCAAQKDFRVECTKTAEPNRQTYYRLLVPDAAKRQVAGNRAYIESLKKRGDDTSAMRRIGLYFYFPTAQARAGFILGAREAGFAIGRDDYIPEHDPPYYLALHGIVPLEQAAVTRMTTVAIYAAEPYGGVFDHLDSAFIPKRTRL